VWRELSRLDGWDCSRGVSDLRWLGTCPRRLLGAGLQRSEALKSLFHFLDGGNARTVAVAAITFVLGFLIGRGDTKGGNDYGKLEHPKTLCTDLHGFLCEL
jgi:hypothetical protein